MMNSVSVQIQRAISEAISNQVLPQIQNALMADSGHMTKERWNIPSERPEGYSEVLRNADSRNNLKSKTLGNREKDGFTFSDTRAYDTSKNVFGKNDQNEITPTGKYATVIIYRHIPQVP